MSTENSCSPVPPWQGRGGYMLACLHPATMWAGAALGSATTVASSIYLADTETNVLQVVGAFLILTAPLGIVVGLTTVCVGCVIECVLMIAWRWRNPR